MKKETKFNDNVKRSEGYAKALVCIIGVLYVLLALFCFFKPGEEYSLSERRKLAQMPKLTWEALKTGEFADKTEEYVVDQFPLRDAFRALKSCFSLGVMCKQDTNGIYVKDGYLSKMEYPMDESSIKRAASVFEKIYTEYLQNTDTKAYIAVVPDKNYFLAGERSSQKEDSSVEEQSRKNDALPLSVDSTILAMDYDVFFSKVYEKTPFLEPIAIEETLTLTDYYKTDTHWKQEGIIDTAAVLAKRMGVPFDGDFELWNVEKPFYGVYYGQAGLPVAPDEIMYCNSAALDKCTVFDYENNKQISLYDLSKTDGKDPYEMFLGGNISLVKIENTESLSAKELIVFGDSFSRSLLPLLAESYQKITLIDIRYLPSEYIGNYVEFDGQDILFLYSTSVLNNSITLK